MEVEAKCASEKKWRALTRVQRRVLGVLVEKSKTTPDIYPMTLNALTTASNQKSNRKPLMQLEPDDVEEALEELREMGAVVELQSDSRKPKFKHQLYQWLDVGKVELAVVAELLLRGEQTLGDLRGRASRMEKITDVADLKPIVNGLIEKNLMIELTPEGRGQIVTHNLYQPEELAKLERQMGEIEPGNQHAEKLPVSRRTATPAAPVINHELQEIRNEIQQLHELVEQLRNRVDLLEQRG